MNYNNDINLGTKSKIIGINGSKPDKSGFILTPNTIINIKFRNSIFRFSESVKLASVEYGGYFSNNRCDRCIIKTRNMRSTHCRYFNCKLNDCYLILPSDIKFELNLMSMLSKFRDNMTSKMSKSLVRTLKYSLCNPDLCYNYYECQLKDVFDSIINESNYPISHISTSTYPGVESCVFNMAVRNVEKCNFKDDLKY